MSLRELMEGSVPLIEFDDRSRNLRPSKLLGIEPLSVLLCKLRSRIELRMLSSAGSVPDIRELLWRLSERSFLRAPSSVGRVPDNEGFDSIARVARSGNRPISVGMEFCRLFPTRSRRRIVFPSQIVPYHRR